MVGANKKFIYKIGSKLWSSPFYIVIQLGELKKVAKHYTTAVMKNEYDAVSVCINTEQNN